MTGQDQRKHTAYIVGLYTHGMLNRVVHDDVILSYWQPGAKCDDVPVPERFRTLPFTTNKASLVNKKPLEDNMHFIVLRGEVVTESDRKIMLRTNSTTYMSSSQHLHSL